MNKHEEMQCNRSTYVPYFLQKFGMLSYLALSKFFSIDEEIELNIDIPLLKPQPSSLLLVYK